MRALRAPLVVLLCLLATAIASADELPAENPAGQEAGRGEATKPASAPTPADVWEAINTEVADLPTAERGRVLRSRAWAFLQAWRERGETATGEELYALGLLRRQALQRREAVAAFAAVAVDVEVPVAVRDLAAANEALLLLNERAREGLNAEALHARAERLRGYAEAMTEPDRQRRRMSIHANAASLLAIAGRADESLELFLQTTLEHPEAARYTYRAILRNLVGRSHTMDGYAAVRASALAAMLILRRQQQLAIREAEQRLQVLRAEGDDVGAAKAERAFTGAQGILERIEAAARPFEMLGEPVPPWTLDRAFGDVSDLAGLRGKVVVLDFWATWCGWCIKSFPAIRDLLSDYGDEGLVVVGVTATAKSVYEHRYDIDEDLEAKVKEVEGRYQPKVGARLASGGTPANGETVLEAEPYREKEREVLAAFLRNHEVTWPVVMIDENEPGPKYALTGWPHAVVLDREGRVRYFKYGPLLRDRPQDLAAFRKVLEDLLAEPAEE